MDIFVIVFCISAGIFSSFCALKDYDFFMNSRRAAFFVKLLGRNGARVFYFVLGIAIIGAAVYMLLERIAPVS